MTFLRRMSDFYQKHQKHAVVLFFIGGLLLDILLLERIDSMAVVGQHALYIFIVGFLLTFEVIDTQNKLQLPRFLQKIWPFRDEAVHFLLGALLSAFAIFYFLSASLLNTFIFFAVLVFLLVANELEGFRKIGLSIRFVMFTVCLCSFFGYLIPIFWGSVGAFPFVVSLILSGVVLHFICLFLQKRLGDSDFLRSHIARPAQSVLIVFLTLYIFQLIPPVPLSLKKIGIYHAVTKTSEGYELSHEQPWWKFWRSGDQHFVAQAGDRIYCFFSLFSPTGFQDQVKVRWMYRGPNGWSGSDAIPVKITGGRDQGFRGFTFKENYQDGDWQVRVETEDGREIGRLNFSVKKAAEPKVDREFFKAVQ